MIRRLAVAFVLVALGSSVAGAAEDPFGLRWTTLSDGGAIPFFYGTGLIAIGAFTLLEPPDLPRLFSADEGGATEHEASIPDYQVGVLGVATAIGIGALDRQTRWFHVKGMLQSFATTAALTELAKSGFGRHRPSFDPDTSTAEDRKSFFSGHASLTFASMTYLGLFVHGHVDRRWHIPAYAGIAGLALYVPYTRLDENKHHASDLVTGAVVGTAISVGFYAWQQRRFERAALRGRESHAPIALAPWLGAGTRGVQIFGQF